MSTSLTAPSISASDLRAAVATFYHSRRVPLFIGPPGCAKTAMIRLGGKDIAAIHQDDCPVVELHLASMSEVDVRGFLIPNGDQAMFTKPLFWAMVEKHKRGILFLDEFVQATHEMQKTVAPLILEGTIGEFTLPPGWVVMCAGNDIDDNAGANTLLSHVLNRVCRINVTPPEVDQWVQWALASNLSPEMVAFAKLRPGVVFESKIPDGADTPWCTPRSLHAASDISMAFPGGVRAMVDSTMGMAMLCGSIGGGAAAELAGVVRLAINLPSFEEVVAAPDTVRVPESLSEAYAMIMLVAVRAKADTNGEAAVKYLTRFQPNLALTGLVSMINRDPNFVNSTIVANWVSNNRELLGKFQKYIHIGTR